MDLEEITERAYEKYPRQIERKLSDTVDHNLTKRNCYIDGMTDGADLTMRRACETYCDLICKDAMSCGCMYKYNGRGEVMLNFDYMTCPCNPLTTLRFWTNKKREINKVNLTK